MEDEVWMVSFNLGKDEADEVVASVEWADEFDLMPWDDQIQFLLQAIEQLEEALQYCEDAAMAEDLSEEEDEDEEETADDK